MANQKGLVARIERMLEDGVGDVFARVFGGSIVPQEVEAMLRREASDGLQSLPGDRYLAPNDYVITLGESDYQKFNADREFTSDAFARHLAGYIQDQQWQTYGAVVVRFEQSEGLHTGQYRARAVVNPDADPRAPLTPPAQAESIHAYHAEPGAPAMTDNPTYRGGPGRPGDEFFDDQYGRPQDEPRAGVPEHARPAYPQDQGYQPRPAYPEQGGYEQGYAPGGPGYGPGYAPAAPGYDQRPQPGYPQPGYDQGYRQAPPPGYGQPSYGPPPGAGYPPPAGDYDYGRPAPGRYDEPGHGHQRQDYPPQSGYPQPGYGNAYGRPDYPQQDYAQPEYGQPDYGRYDQGGYPPPAAPAAPVGEYEYGQAAPGGYQPAGYAPPGGPAEYGATGRAVTLQLDDGSGRTYALREGANVIGRGQDAQFRLPDTGVSRRHVEIRWDGQVALLSDLNSTNGTTVNNAPVQEWQLADGDVIRLGHSEIVVHVH